MREFTYDTHYHSPFKLQDTTHFYSKNFKLHRYPLVAAKTNNDIDDNKTIFFIPLYWLFIRASFNVSKLKGINNIDRK